MTEQIGAKLRSRNSAPRCAFYSDSLVYWYSTMTPMRHRHGNNAEGTRQRCSAAKMLNCLLKSIHSPKYNHCGYTVNITVIPPNAERLDAIGLWPNQRS